MKEPIDRLIEILQEMKQFQDEYGSNDSKEFQEQAQKLYENACYFAQDQRKGDKTANDPNDSRSAHLSQLINVLIPMKILVTQIINHFCSGKDKDAMICLGVLFNTLHHYIDEAQHDA